MSIFSLFKRKVIVAAKPDDVPCSSQPESNQHAVDPDKDWGALQQRALREAAANDWGLYTNTQLKMVEHLEKQGRADLALEHLLWVLYLDINGPENRSGVSGALLKEFPPFDQKTGLVPPALIPRVGKLRSGLGLDVDACGELFVRSASRRRNPLMKVSPERAWRLLASNMQSNAAGPSTRAPIPRTQTSRRG